MVIVPRVTTIGCTRPPSASAALASPPAVPTSSAAATAPAMASPPGQGSFSTSPPTAAERASSEPIEMSMPPTRITVAAPSDRMIHIAALEARPVRLFRLKKASLVTASAANRTAMAAAKASSLPRAAERPPHRGPIGGRAPGTRGRPGSGGLWAVACQCGRPGGQGCRGDRLGRGLLGVELAGHAPLAKDHDPVGVFHHFRQVGADQHHRRAAVGQFGQQPMDFRISRRRRRRESARRAAARPVRPAASGRARLSAGCRQRARRSAVRRRDT